MDHSVNSATLTIILYVYVQCKSVLLFVSYSPLPYFKWFVVTNKLQWASKELVLSLL